ncbi:cytochrome c oxidase subunit 4 [Motilibacter aurantiacus]|uniref:cytochrome c oxidase subunit 4 n=1 Tax=Motilibacter aurantiacus TaxID=2714955 RepID=UPI00140A039B|nr:cytochrome c oxidase subunit 4 [Motilibacter aurantiacus]NHC44895.1 cytochrome c oxidase subunit 4 [Motilibacter aurantiacus]
MKVEGWLFASGVIFFGAIAIIYGVVIQEPVGTTALAFTAGLSLLVGFYTLFTARRIGLRPEDRKDAEIAESAGEIGFFSPTSWWPLAVASGAALVTLGLVFGWWLVGLGAAALIMAVIGMVFEYYRGEHSH